MNQGPANYAMMVEHQKGARPSSTPMLTRLLLHNNIGSIACLRDTKENISKWDFQKGRQPIVFGFGLLTTITLYVEMIGNAIWNKLSPLNPMTSKSHIKAGSWIDISLQWRHNGHDGVSNHRRLDYLNNSLFRRTSKKTSKLLVTGLCEGNQPVTGRFPSQRASNTENVSIWRRRHVYPNTMHHVP